MRHGCGGDRSHWREHRRRRGRRLFVRFAAIFGVIALLIFGVMALLAWLASQLFGGDGQVTAVVWLISCGLVIALPLMAAGVAGRRLPQHRPPAGRCHGGRRRSSRRRPERTRAGARQPRVSPVGAVVQPHGRRAGAVRPAAPQPDGRRRPRATHPAAYHPGQSRGCAGWRLRAERRTPRRDPGRDPAAGAAGGRPARPLAGRGRPSADADGTGRRGRAAGRRGQTSFSGQAEAAGVKLVVELAEPRDELFVTGDAGRLDQVIGNLVANALRHTPRDGIDHAASRSRCPKACRSASATPATGYRRRSCPTSSTASGHVPRAAAAGWGWPSRAAWCRRTAGESRSPVNKGWEPT